jgi:hypothetical protein
LKSKYGIISEKMADIGQKRIETAREMMHQLDDILGKDSYEEELSMLKPKVDKINSFPVSEKIQLELPVGLVKLRFWNSLWSWLTGR